MCDCGFRSGEERSVCAMLGVCVGEGGGDYVSAPRERKRRVCLDISFLKKK